MAQPLPGVTKVLAVASGKGGVGKTTVTVNLALAFQQLGMRVGLFDADIYGPDVPLMLGVHRMEGVQGLAGMIPIARTSHQPYIRPMERFGVKLMSFGLVVGERDTVITDVLLVGKAVSQTVRDVVWGELDYLLIDFPPGSGEPQHTLIREVKFDGAVLVTTPQDLSLLDAGRTLGMFGKVEVPILGVIENMSYLLCPHCGERINVFHQSDRTWAIQDEALDVIGHVPMGTAMSRAIDAGHPLVQAAPSGAESMLFREIALRIQRKLAG